MFKETYYWAFLLAVILCWSPFKAVAYSSPLLALAVVLLIVPRPQFLLRVAVWSSVFAIVTILHFLFSPHFLYNGAILSFFTYGSFLFAFSISGTEGCWKDLLARMSALVSKVVIFESAIGIVQAVYGFLETGSFDLSNGDFVEGTIDIALQCSDNFSNVMFASNMVFSILFLVPWVAQGHYRFSFVLGCLTLILSSVVHLLIFAALAGMLAYYLYAPHFKHAFTRGAFYIGLIGMVLFAITALRTNFNQLPVFASEFIDGRSPRRQVLDRVVFDAPRVQPLVAIFGMGPGQFCSRAGMISTGMYFGGPSNPRAIPIIGGQVSTFQEHYFMDLWYWASTTTWYGSAQQPFFSWLSLYAEFGALGFLLVLAFSIFSLTRVAQYAAHPHQGWQVFAYSTGLLLLMLLGLNENYWEVPQAIFPGIMMLKAMRMCFSNAAESNDPANIAENG